MPVEDRAEKVMTDVVQALRAKRPQQAVRLFVEGMDHGIAPAAGDLSRWLVKMVGTRDAVLLIKALAYHPCFYCNKGLELCEYCKNRQRASWRKRACEKCLDFGMARCDFCDGTGWVTYNFIPGGLWIAVMAERTNTAIKEVNALLKKDLPDPTPANCNKLGDVLEQHILAANRLAGVLENAVLAAKTRLSADPSTEKHVNNVIQACGRTWPRLRGRTVELLKNLAQAIQLQASRAATANAKELMSDRAKFYLLLSRSNGFPGTGLAHPFLVQSGKA